MQSSASGNPQPFRSALRLSASGGKTEGGWLSGTTILAVFFFHGLEARATLAES
jgi:hypothetical protein